MAFSAGMRVGPYEIESRVGAGGMGEVYRATDTRLNRTVAIKTLPEHLSSSPDLRARFEREAKTISALQHANICVLHDVGTDAGVDFLVMEYLEGETLATRLARKPLSFEESMRVAIAIGRALDAAHRQGIVHRDLKPGNIMLTKGGAKLMDFGLAKPYALAATASTPMFSAAATITSPASPITSAGTVVGTVHYMSPEQIQGHQVDTRTDIFAFGATLYEMISGKRAFDGKSQVSVASAILEKDPPGLASIRPGTPPLLDRLVRKCLAKDPEERWQNAHDLVSDLEWIAEAAAQPAEARQRKSRMWLAAALGVLLLAASSVALWRGREPKNGGQLVVTKIDAPSDTQFRFGLLGISAPLGLPPDGHALAFVATDRSGKSMIWVRGLDSLEARIVPGTESASDLFWSSDYRTITFFADQKLKTVLASGGPVTTVAEAPIGFGASWNREQVLLFTPDPSKGIYVVRPTSATPTPLVVPQDLKVSLIGWPQFLPDNKHFIFVGTTDPASSISTYYGSLDRKEFRVVAHAGAAYADGFLFHVRGSTLSAQPFDATSGRVTGETHAIAQGVVNNFFSVSENGLLAYTQGNQLAKALKWFDRTGKEVGSVGEIDDYFDVRLSPDGKRIAVNSGRPNSNIWVYDSVRSVRTKLTFESDTDHGMPVWAPDGSRIVFAEVTGRNRKGLYVQSSNGAGREALLLGGEQLRPWSWSRDGKYLLYTVGDPNGDATTIWVLALGGDSKPEMLVQAPAAVYDSQFSPDVRWVAYTSRESGRDEIYIVPFDGSRGVHVDLSHRVSASTQGGRYPRWRGDGKEIFWLSSSSEVMAAPVEVSGTTMNIGSAHALFRFATQSFIFLPYDVTPDGSRFIVNAFAEQDQPITLMVNWQAKLKDQRK
jgi:serine/threonine protein kinase/Tol biopolymer transport system component